MKNINSILIEGNLVKDPMLRSARGTHVCTMKLATNRYYKIDKQSDDFEKEVSFFDVETWAKLAESCYVKGRKGRGLCVVGRLKQSRWNDPNGKQHSKVTIVAEHVEFRSDFQNNKKTASNETTYESEVTYGIDYTGTAMSEKAFEHLTF